MHKTININVFAIFQLFINNKKKVRYIIWVLLFAELKRFTIPELCKSKFSSKNQEETENDEQQVTEEENEASEVLA